MTSLTGASPQVVRIDLRDDAMRPVGELEVDVDPHGADFRPAIAGVALPCLLAWASTRAWLSAQDRASAGGHVRVMVLCIHDCCVHG